MTTDEQGAKIAKAIAEELIIRQNEFGSPLFEVNRHYPTGVNAVWLGALTAFGWAIGLSWALGFIAAIKWVLS